MPFKHMDKLNPYAVGEWVKLEIIKESASESSLSTKDTSEECEEPSHILRGPLWNYGRRENNEDYFDELLFGKKKKTLFTKDELIVKGEEWTPSKPTTASLAEYFFKNMKKIDPGRIAVTEIETGRTMTYGELIQKAQSLACGLRWLGVLPGHVVAVISHNSIEAQLMILASLLVGSIAALVDSSLNAADIGSLLRIGTPRLVFCEGGRTFTKVQTALCYLISFRIPKLVVNSSLQTRDCFTFSQLLKEVEPNFKPAFRRSQHDLPVLILFTSGTTGTAKGVLIPERFFMSSKMFRESVYVMAGYVYTTLITAPIFWISAVTTFLIHLDHGHHIAFFRGRVSEAVIISALSKFKVLLWVVGPASLMKLLHWPAKPRCSTLKNIIVSGMCISAKNIIRVRDQVFDNKIHICQIYGLTETGVLTGNTPAMNKIGSIGKVFYNIQMKVVEPCTGIALGPDEEGELCFKSPSMMLGYYNNPEATNAVYDEEGFFHTGDLGYYDGDEFVFITGRIKELIKWRSFQTMPVIVETALLAHPAVNDALVFGIYDENDGELVTAAIILKQGYEDTHPEIIQEVTNQQLSYGNRIRGGVHVFTKFPSTATGKPIKSSVARQVLERLALY